MSAEIQRKVLKTDFNEFFNAMLVCALWSSTDENGEPLDRDYSISDIESDCLEELKAHAFSFWSRMWYYLDHESPNGKSASDAGHDFWLTSQGHGSGFWDGDWPKYGEMLTKLSKCYPGEMRIDFKER